MVAGPSGEREREERGPYPYPFLQPSSLFLCPSPMNATERQGEG